MSNQLVPFPLPGLPNEAGCAVQPSCSPSLQEGRASIKAGQTVVLSFWGEVLRKFCISYLAILQLL